MSVPQAYNTYEEYFHDALSFLEEYSWLFDTAATKLLVKDVMSKLPSEWKSYLLDLNNEELNSLPTGYVKNHWPPSLIDFCKKCQDLTITALASPPDLLYKNFDIPVPREMWRGVTSKKKCEVELLTSLIHNECQQTGVSRILDLGSGLGYVDRLLLWYGYRILGLESSSDLVRFATIQKNDFFPLSISKNANYIKCQVMSDSQADIKDAVDKYLLSENNDKVSETDNKLKEIQYRKCYSKILDNYEKYKNNTDAEKLNNKTVCMIGLHACGDLAVSAMQTFLLLPEVQLFIMVPCCYHKMALKKCNLHDSFGDLSAFKNRDQLILDSTDSDSASEEFFHNFPLSRALSKTVSLHLSGCQYLCRPFLRLASQRSSTSWADWTELDHDKHAFNVLSRAVLEKYAGEEGLSLKKCFRRVVRKSHVSTLDFTSYVDDAMGRFDLIDNKTKKSIKSNEVVQRFRNGLLSVWNQYGSDLKLVEIITALQMCIQPVAESLVVADRAAFLLESGIGDLKVVKMIDANISPRCLAYVARKSSNVCNLKSG